MCSYAQINKDKPYIAEIGKKDAYGDKATMARKSTHNYGTTIILSSCTQN